MHFAILEGERVEPEKGLKGAVCPICKQPVYARCGEQRMDHWAHKSLIDCDPWKEMETQWHRDWKNRFGDLQERMHEQNGVRHMADVKTDDGFVVEFRRVFINAEGITRREHFFGKKMLWVVDLEHRANAHDKFLSEKYALLRVDVPGMEAYRIGEAKDLFPSRWTNVERIVAFDFGEPRIWMLFPKRKRDWNVLCVAVSKDEFVEDVKSGYAKFREKYGELWKKTIGAFQYAAGIGSVRQVQQQRAAPEHERPAPAPLRRDAEKPAPKPKEEDYWSGEYDRNVSLCITVDAVAWWLVSSGFLRKIRTRSKINGEANATGRCVIHVKSFFNPQEAYWAQRRLTPVVDKSALAAVPPYQDLEKDVGKFVALADYHVIRAWYDEVEIALRVVKPLDRPFAHPHSSEAIWRLDGTLVEQISDNDREPMRMTTKSG